uniref:Peptidase S54 rhomboid domain-containing protein n=1 Tax=Timema poppense TaxID=170557 RepID=A0A7R9CYS0_TIMPO|nr:unnamed protein product [Timema poppensis]
MDNVHLLPTSWSDSSDIRLCLRKLLWTDKITILRSCESDKQTLLYMGIFKPPWRKWDICISAESILKEHDYKRLFVSPLEHGDDLHLYYNMISFLVKGRSLETRYGSPNFALLLAILSTLTSFMYVGLGRLCMEVFQDYYYMKSCAIGFSGVIFALKVVTSKEEPQGMSNIGGVLLPVRYAAWAELVLIHILVPRASFMGHLAGILAGLMYTSTPLGDIIDHFLPTITGDPMRHSPYY